MKKKRNPLLGYLEYHKRNARTNPPRCPQYSFSQLQNDPARLVDPKLQSLEPPQVQAEREEALERFADLYNFAPVGYFILKRNGRISQSNLFGADLLLVDRGHLINQRFDQYIHEDRKLLFKNYLDQVFRSHIIETCEVEFQRKGGQPGWIQIEAFTKKNSAECRAVVIDITARKKVEYELQQVNMHDVLTGLYNRAYFYESIKHLEHGRHFPISIILADIDHFKIVNDKYGHDVGDSILIRAAQVLTAAVRSEDIVARIGGDEFGVLLPETDEAEVLIILKRLNQILDEKNAAFSEPALKITLGRFTAGANISLEQSIKLADSDLYFRKRERVYSTGREVPINGLTTAELRSRAEEQHRQNFIQNQKPHNPVDALRVVHELEVHQIELDIQNEELLRSRGELEDALERFTDLFDFAPIGYFSLEPDGTIVQVNLNGALMLDVERSQLVGDHFGRFIREEDQAGFSSFLEKISAGRSKETCEIALLNTNGSKVWVQIEGTVFGDQKRYRIVVVDINARKLSEDKLLLLQDQLDLLLKKVNQAKQILKITVDDE